MRGLIDPEKLAQISAELFSPVSPEDRDPVREAQTLDNLAAWFREHAFDEIDEKFIADHSPPPSRDVELEELEALADALAAQIELPDLARLAGMLAHRVAHRTPIPKHRTHISHHECWIRSDDTPTYEDAPARFGIYFCVYDRDSDPSCDSCIFCHQPEERK